MTTFVLVAVIAWGTAAWLSIFVLVPSCAHSIFRHQLWRLRDSAYDDVVRGALTDPTPFRGFIRELEFAIDVADEITPLRLGLMGLTSRRLREDEQIEVEFFDPAKVHPDDRRAAHFYYWQFHTIFFKQLVFGSPTGWLLMVLLVLATVPIALYRAARQRVFGSAEVTHPTPKLVAGLAEYEAPERWNQPADLEERVAASQRVEVFTEAKRLAREKLAQPAEPEEVIAFLRGRRIRAGLSVC
jgi:hypothetical protein